MRFLRMELNNWRSLGGRHQFNFATERKRNVTVFIGENGAGKTALLNAFTWVLFGETTAGFRKPNDLFNHAALDAIEPGARDTMEVILVFDHDGAEYEVKRFQEAERPLDNNDPVVGEKKLIATCKSGGITDSIDQDEVNDILPPGLHPFFFFPAENIGRDINQNDLASIRASMSSAIDVLLGIEKYDNALKIVSKALTAHLKNPSNAPKDELVVAAEQGAKAARRAWADADKRKKELPGIINTAKQLASDLLNQMEASEAYEGAAKEFKEVEADIVTEQDKIGQAREDQVASINRNCAIVFGNRLFADAQGVLDQAHKDLKIPPRVSAGLLDELIEHRQRCLCGREIGDCERQELHSLRCSTLEDVIVEIANDLRGRLPSLIENNDVRTDEAAAGEIGGFDKDAALAEARLTKLKVRKKQLLDEQPEISYSDPTKIREAWKLHEKTLMGYQHELEGLNKELSKLEGAKNDAESRYQKALNRNTQAKSIGAARGLLSSVEGTLSKIQESVRACARKDVERAMNTFYTAVLLKNYTVHLTEDFQHKIIDESTGKTVGVSSSEIALATFAFVGALAALMPVYARLEELLPGDDGKSIGSISADTKNAYPVVIDAPYSPFGEDYAGKFSEALPDLLPQSIIIVREEQIKYLDKPLRDKRIGAGYLLQLYSTKGNRKTVTWQDKEFGYVIKTDAGETDYTRIVPLPVE